jgi:glycosyltransferase involved in cell wall biosynthesis
MKTASIIIPTFNRAGLVHRAIESAINQTYPCEVILCDHGSTDNTPQIATQYNDKIRYIRREKDNGPIVCWRDGLKQSTGEVIHFTYDDDWIEPAFMEKTIALLKADVGFVYTNFIIHDHDKGRGISMEKHPAGIRPMDDAVKLFLRCPATAISPGCAIFRRKDALKNLLSEIPNAAGIYGKNSGVGEDALLFLLTSLDYPKYAYVPEPLACFLSHSGSITINALGSEKKEGLKNAYRNAKLYYFNQPGSLSPQSKWEELLFILRWKYESRILITSPLCFVGRCLLKLVRGVYFKRGYWRSR